MLAIDNQTSIILQTHLLEKITNKLSLRDVELLLVDERSMQKINKDLRQIDKPTDVLSFPFDSMGLEHIPLGSIVICLPIAKKFASFYGHSLEEEVALLFIHGILHLKGFNHEADNGEHRKEEERWVEFFNLPKSLIIRNTQN